MCCQACVLSVFVRIFKMNDREVIVQTLTALLYYDRAMKGLGTPELHKKLVVSSILQRLHCFRMYLIKPLEK